jgi:hypothetical protein
MSERSPPYILFKGQFPGELYKEKLLTDVPKAVESFPPSRPAPWWGLWSPSSGEGLVGGP